MGRAIAFNVHNTTLEDLCRKSDFFPLNLPQDKKSEVAPANKEIVQVSLEIYIALFLPFLLGFILAS